MIVETALGTPYRLPQEELLTMLKIHKVPLARWDQHMMSQLTKEQTDGYAHLHVEDGDKLVRVVTYVALILEGEDNLTHLEMMTRVLPGEYPIETIRRVVNPDMNILFNSQICLLDHSDKTYPGLPTKNSIYTYKVQIPRII